MGVASQARKTRPLWEGTEIQTSKSKQIQAWLKDSEEGDSRSIGQFHGQEWVEPLLGGGSDGCPVGDRSIDDGPSRLGWHWFPKDVGRGCIGRIRERLQLSANKGETPASAANWNRNPNRDVKPDIPAEQVE